MTEEPIRKGIREIQEEVGELARRALIQAGDLREVEDKLRAITEKASEATPHLEVPRDENPD